MTRIRMIFKRIGCLFGRHWYRPADIKVSYSHRDALSGEDFWNTERTCVYCGKRTEDLINIIQIKQLRRNDE